MNEKVTLLCAFSMHKGVKNRQCLNTTNIYFTYLFYVVQMVGLMTTSVAQSYNMNNIVWVGIGLNSLATLIHTFEQTNTKLSNHMLENITNIKNGTYVDEGILIDIDERKGISTNTNTNTIASHI